MKLLVVGSLNMDLVILTDRPPQKGETLAGSGFTTVCGGKGANQAIAAAKLGADVSMIGKVGNDVFAEKMLKNLAHFRVGTKGVTAADMQSGIAVINVFGSDNTIIVDKGANASLTADDIDRNIELLRDCDAVLMQFEIPFETVMYVAKKAKELGKYVIINPAPVQNMPAELLKCTDLLILNEHEAAFLSNLNVTSENVELSAGCLLKKGVGEVLITLGGEGSYYLSPTASCKVPALKVKPVDTTAAGDTYTAGYIIRKSDTGNTESAMRFASAAAAIAVTRLGASVSVPTKAEVEYILTQQKSSS